MQNEMNTRSTVSAFKFIPWPHNPKHNSDGEKRWNHCNWDNLQAFKKESKPQLKVK